MNPSFQLLSFFLGMPYTFLLPASEERIGSLKSAVIGIIRLEQLRRGSILSFSINQKYVTLFGNVCFSTIIVGGSQLLYNRHSEITPLSNSIGLVIPPGDPEGSLLPLDENSVAWFPHLAFYLLLRGKFSIDG